MVQGCEFFSNGGQKKTSDQERTCKGNEQVTSTTKTVKNKEVTEANSKPKSDSEEQVIAALKRTRKD